MFVAVLVASLASIPLLWAKVNRLLPEAVLELVSILLLSFSIISLVYFQASMLQKTSFVKQGGVILPAVPVGIAGPGLAPCGGGMGRLERS